VTVTVAVNGVGGSTTLRIVIEAVASARMAPGTTIADSSVSARARLPADRQPREAAARVITLPAGKSATVQPVVAAARAGAARAAAGCSTATAVNAATSSRWIFPIGRPP
jgi:hypothetical protein